MFSLLVQHRTECSSETKIERAKMMKPFNMKTLDGFKAALDLCNQFSRLDLNTFANAGKTFSGKTYCDRVKDLVGGYGACGGLKVVQNEKGGYEISRKKGESIIPYLPIVTRGLIVKEEYKKTGTSLPYVNFQVLIEDEECSYQKLAHFFSECMLNAFVAFLKEFKHPFEIEGVLKDVIARHFELKVIPDGLSESDLLAEKISQFEKAWRKNSVEVLTSLCKKALKGTLLKTRREGSEEETKEFGLVEPEYFKQMFVTLFSNQMKIMVNKESHPFEWEECEITPSVSMKGVQCCFVNIFKKITIAKDGNIYISPVTAQIWPLASCMKTSIDGIPIASEAVLRVRKEAQSNGGIIKLPKTQIGDLSFMEKEEDSSPAIISKKKRRTAVDIEVPVVKRRKIEAGSPLLEIPDKKKKKTEEEATLPMDLTLPLTPERAPDFESYIVPPTPPRSGSGLWFRSRREVTDFDTQSEGEDLDAIMERKRHEEFIPV